MVLRTLVEIDVNQEKQRKTTRTSAALPLRVLICLWESILTRTTMATKTENGGDSQPTFYEDEENLRKLCDFLRSSEGPPVREALLMEKRVHYLKGTGEI